MTGATATLASPEAGGSIDVDALNSQGYIDVTFAPAAGGMLDTTSIVNTTAKFTISGSGASAVTLSSAAPTLVSGTTYSFPFTGQFTPGVVTVSFIADTWKDQGDTTGALSGNLASTQTFTVQGTTADLTNPSSGGSIGLDAINAQGFIEVTFTATQGHTITPSTIDGNELTVQDASGNSITLGTPQLVAGTQATYEYPFTGSLAVGTYTVTFKAGSFADNSGATNLQSTETFVVEQPTFTLTNPGPGGVIDVDALNNQGYIDIQFNPTSGAAVDPTTISSGVLQLSGTGAENVTLGTPTQPGSLAGTNVYQVPFTGTFDVGDVTVTFVPGIWKDTAGNGNAGSTQVFHIIADAANFFISISGEIELNATSLVSTPLMTVQADATLEIDNVRHVFTLSFSGQLSIIELGTVGATSGQFILDTDNSTLVPQFWGVASLQTNFSVLNQYGLYLNGSGLLQINTTDSSKTETLTLQGVGPGGSNLTQTYTLAADSFAIQETGSLELRPPGSTSDLAELQGGFYIQLNPTEFDIFAVATVSLGSGSSAVTLGQATGLIVAQTGLGAGQNAGVGGYLSIGESSNIGLPDIGSLFQASGSVTVIFNTTLQTLTFNVPQAFVPLLNPGDPTTFTIYAGAPLANGTQNPAATASVYVTTVVQAQLTIGGALTLTGFLEFSVSSTGNTTTEVITGNVSTSIQYIGALTGSLNFVATSSTTPSQDGIVGRVFLTLTANQFPGVSLSGQFLLELNTFSTSQTVDTLEIATDSNGNFTGFVKDANGNVELMNQAIAPGFRLEMNGSLSAFGIVTIQGFFEFTISTSGVSIAVTGTMALSPLGTITVSGDLSVTGLGMVAYIDVSAGVGNFGQNFGLAFTATFTLELNTTGSAQTVTTGQTVQPGFLLDINGTVSFTGFASATGDVQVSISNSAFQIYFNVTFDLGPLDVQAAGFAGIYNDSSPGIAMSLSVSINADILGGIFDITASGQLLVNTTNMTRNGIGANEFHLNLSGEVKILFVLNFNASFTIQVGGGNMTVWDGTVFNLTSGQWAVNFNAQMSFFGLATLSCEGWLKSDGTFHLHLNGDLLLGSSQLWPGRRFHLRYRAHQHRLHRLGQRVGPRQFVRFLDRRPWRELQCRAIAADRSAGAPGCQRERDHQLLLLLGLVRCVVHDRLPDAAATGLFGWELGGSDDLQWRRPLPEHRHQGVVARHRRFDLE